MPDTTGAYTVVKNNIQSPAESTFSFLPPHGKTLAANEEYSIFGNIWDRLCNGGGRLNERKRAALEAALLAGDLEIVHTPHVIIEDTSTSAIKTIKVTGGTLDDTDPSWGAFDDISS